MTTKIQSLFPPKILAVLGGIWLSTNLGDRLWLALDRSVPAWDQSNHLTNSLAYLQAIQTAQWFNGDWWHTFWSISTKYPPVTYIASAFFQLWLGKGDDEALLVNWFYSAILLLSVYLLGATLLSPKVGLWAAAITPLLPRHYETRLLFLLDTPLLAFTLASFCCLTLWRDQTRRRNQWLFAIAFGLFWGIALLTKQSVMFFLFFPLLGLGGYYLWTRRWERILQLILSFGVSAIVWFLWYRTNWIFLFSTIQNSNSIPASLEGDPPLNTLAAWTYYWQDLPFAVSWVLLIVPIVGLLLHLWGRFPQDKDGIDSKTAGRGLAWLALYFCGAYLVCSAIYNKDSRYILPYLPVLAIFLAYGLVQWRGRWTWVRWATIALAILIAIAKLFPLPIPEYLAQSLSPSVYFRPYLGQPVPDSELIETVIQTQPYQSHNLGVIANTESVNHNTLNFFGTLRDFQVKGRELGVKPEEVQQDGRSLDWFVTKTGENGFARDTQLALAERLNADPQFQRVKQWQMPDKSELRLFHRKTPVVSVEPFSPVPSQVTLDRVVVPEVFPPGYPVPVRYEWVGKGQALAKGIVLLTWRSQNPQTPQKYWIQDHGIGMGKLFGTDDERGFRVVENTAMLPPADLPAGDYQLEAIYLNRETGTTTPIPTPKTIVTLDPRKAPISSPELDLVTQLRQLALNLPKGIKGLDPIFQQVDRLNQYDPTQDYLTQGEIALNYRLKHDPDPQVQWRYGVILANVLQQDAQPLIEHLKTLIKQDPSNPYFSAYLAFVYLYNWQPHYAETALQPALVLAKDVPEIQGLNAIAALMQGNIIKAWQIGAPLLKKS